MSDVVGTAIALAQLAVGLAQLFQGSARLARDGSARLARVDDRKREEARVLIRTQVRQGVDEFIVDLRQQDPRFRGVEIPVDALVAEICAIIELELDSSLEVIRETLAGARAKALLQDMQALRLVLPMMENFVKWCELQIPSLVAIRRDAGFSDEDCEELRAIWTDHYALYWKWLERLKADQS